MKARVLSLFYLLLVAGAFVDLGAWEESKSWLGKQTGPVAPKIKVLIAEDLDGVYLEVTGGYNVYDPNTHKKLASRFLKKGCFMQPMRGGMKWGEEFPDVFQLLVQPDHPKTTILVNGTQYKGAMYIYQIQSRLYVVNEVDIEDYVKTQLAAEYTQGLDQEAMAAVAIVARTNAYFQSAARRENFWHADAKELGYRGIASHNVNPEITNAVDSTRYLVMVNMNNRDLDGTFAAKVTGHSAGRTVPYHIMYRKDGAAPTKGVTAPYAAMDKASSSWTFSVAVDDVARALKVSRVEDIQARIDGESKKVLAVQINTGNSKEEFSFHDLQEALGKNRLRSSDFSMALKDNVLTFSGIGDGDGVGLCLFSAKVLASKGKTAEEILEQFFPATRLELVDSEYTRSRHVASYMKEKQLQRAQQL